jgi:hypothetical protein
MTNKQRELLRDMFEVLDNEFDFGSIGKKRFYTNNEASKLINLNKDMFFGIMDEGQCTVFQYNQLTHIAGRTPKLPRYLIGFTQAAEWIKNYKKRA